MILQKLLLILLQGQFELNKRYLDMSSVQLDGSHTPVKRGGIAVAYQGRKKAKTTNMLFLTDQQGIPLACSQPVAGNHNDLFEIEDLVFDTNHPLSKKNLQG